MKRRECSKVKKLFKVLIPVVLAVIAVVVIGLSIFNKGMADIKKLSVESIDVSLLKDGNYFGEYENGRWQYHVEVTVRDGEIKEIRVLNTRTGPFEMKMYDDVNTELIQRIVQNQSLQVDTVTGATVNGKALLKAVENALKEGI